MVGCTDRDMGSLIHAYELNALSGVDEERFEIHLLRCEYCFHEVKSFEREATLLHSDERVKNIVEINAQETSGERLQSESTFKKFLRFIWPDTPIVFRPALAYLLLLLMTLPAYRGFLTMRENRIRSVHTVNLFPDRSVEEEGFTISSGSDGLISFVFRGAVSEKTYEVIIEGPDGSVVFEEDEFTGFDDYETGRLILPLKRMNPGEYRLKIINPRAGPPSNKQEYLFRIEK